MKAVISVVGKDQVGILASVASSCASFGANVLEVTQSVLSDTFAMIMIVNIENLNCSLDDFIDGMQNKGKEKNILINVMHEDIFNSMHKI